MKIYVFIFLLLICFSNANAQWQQQNVDTKASLRGLAVVSAPKNGQAARAARF